MQGFTCPETLFSLFHKKIKYHLNQKNENETNYQDDGINNGIIIFFKLQKKH